MVLNIILIVVAIIIVLIAAVLAFAATRPDNFCIERSASIKAPPEKIFAILNDFHQWRSWSPWEKMDPALNRMFSGTASGKGAIYEWEGNKQVGKGRMEILETVQPSRITIQLDFLKPFEAHHTAEFTLHQQGDSTHVNWAMRGKQPFMFKVMTLFFSMDKMVGKDFEAGLANLKSLTE